MRLEGKHGHESRRDELNLFFYDRGALVQHYTDFFIIAARVDAFQAGLTVA